MINKKLVALASLATLGLTMIPAGVIFAEEKSLNSNARISFTVDNSAKSPLDPTQPANPGVSTEQNPISPIDSVTGGTPNKGTAGPLSIDFASSFNFGSHDISSVTKIYYASAQNYTQKTGSLAKDTTGPNFVQVTDVREGDLKGWSLKVKQNGDFKTADGKTLEGALLTIKNGNALNGNGGEDTIEQVSKEIQLSSADSNVMGAKVGQGRGSWLYRMGTKETAGSSVSLTVPGNISRVEAAYTTTLTWTLSDTAVK
ncbi:WxL domain-containing protein [Pseudolactococcus carnosus]|uniref:WxL domain-containing protein n=1 Tax=Pseudolactococcus carnosus TaxID=2749961 RepID=UPI001FB8A905|nr:WxL domain-containing protein [Lactococcus carnosus]MCJ2002567.1 WxL domain-containing protein [Lactococcus carnosus]